MIGSAPQEPHQDKVDDFRLLQGLTQAATTAELGRDWLAAVLPRLDALPGSELHFLAVIVFNADDGATIPHAQFPANRLAGQILLEAFSDAFQSGQIVVAGRLPGATQDDGQKLSALVLPVLVDGRVAADSATAPARVLSPRR